MSAYLKFEFRVFGPLKEQLALQKLYANDEIECGVLKWLSGEPRSFYASGINALPQR
jgi:hypothetical protein